MPNVSSAVVQQLTGKRDDRKPRTYEESCRLLAQVIGESIRGGNFDRCTGVEAADAIYRVLLTLAGVPTEELPKSAKVEYVKRQPQTREHHCHWPGCEKQVPPAMWGCYKHWMQLPKELRDKIWAAYRPGQEVNGTPSREYVKIAREVQEWISQHEGE